MESSSDVNSLYGSYLVRGNIKPLLEYEEKLDKITLNDISEVAKKLNIDVNVLQKALNETK